MAGMEDQHEKLATVADLVAGQHLAHHLTPKELSWRPDSHSTSESAKHWQEGNTHSQQEKLKVDAHGRYKVTDVDALSTIAERNLQTHGAAKPSEKALQHEMDRIVALNKDQFPDLDSHRDLLHAGMELRIGHHHKKHPSHIDIPPVDQVVHQAPARPALRPAPDVATDRAAAPAPGPLADTAAPYDAPPVQQSDARPVYAQQQTNDVGQGIANFFGGLIGGIGSGFLNGGAFGRGFYDREYNRDRDWDQYDQGSIAYNQGWNRYDQSQALFNQDNGLYNNGWRGGYSHPWRNQDWRRR